MDTLILDKNNISPAKSQLIEYVRDGIRTGRFRPGERLPTTMEFVNAAGVSSNTVRQAMSELVREGALKAVPGMGTFVVDQSSKEDSGRSAVKRVSILPLFHQTTVTLLRDVYRAESARGFFEECERSGLVGSALPGELMRKNPQQFKEVLDASNCQGLVWLYPEPKEWHIIDYLSSFDFPIVVTRRSNIDSDAAFVGADYEKAGFGCCRRFIEDGCRQVLLFNHFDQSQQLDSKHYCGWPIGIKQGLARAFEMFYGDSSRRIEQYHLQGFSDNQTKFIFDAIDAADKKTAVLFTSNYHLYNLLRADRKKTQKLLSERRVALVGNKNFLVNLIPLIGDAELDVLVDPFREIAQFAAQKLAALIDGYFAKTTTLVNVEIKNIRELDLDKYTN